MSPEHCREHRACSWVYTCTRHDRERQLTPSKPINFGPIHRINDRSAPKIREKQSAWRDHYFVAPLTISRRDLEAFLCRRPAIIHLSKAFCWPFLQEILVLSTLDGNHEKAAMKNVHCLPPPITKQSLSDHDARIVLDSSGRGIKGRTRRG